MNLPKDIAKKILETPGVTDAAGRPLTPTGAFAGPNPAAERGRGRDDDPTEDVFQDQVLQLASICGWLRAHFRPAMTADGWRTAVAGDGEGFPDNILLRGPRMVVAELKCKGNEPTAAQRRWLAAFRDAGAETFVWYPADWPVIEATLA